MCVMSMVMDHYHDKWQPYRNVPVPVPQPYPVPYPYPLPQPVPAITPAEVDEFRKLLERAREYDKRTGQPDCELEEKRDKIKKLAKELGVEIDFV